MSKKLKIQFWRAEKALAMQVLVQEGLPDYKKEGKIHIWGSPQLCDDCIFLRGTFKYDDLNIDCITFNNNADCDEYLQNLINAITDELFTSCGERTEPKIEECGQLITYTWEENE